MAVLEQFCSVESTAAMLASVKIDSPSNHETLGTAADIENTKKNNPTKPIKQCSGQLLASCNSVPNAKLRKLCSQVRSGQIKKILVLCGAGISTSSGIPDFRSSTGLYNRPELQGLGQPSDVFDIDFFRKNPKPFYSLAKDLYPGHHKPNPAHYFLRLLEQKGRLLRVCSQNIDGLEKACGLNKGLLVECHGSFSTAHCTACGAAADIIAVKAAIMGDHIARCVRPHCKGIVKPGITFIGEPLPHAFYRMVARDLKRCDLLIIMGTSLAVAPCAELPACVRPGVPRLLVNNEMVDLSGTMVRRQSPAVPDNKMGNAAAQENSGADTFLTSSTQAKKQHGKKKAPCSAADSQVQRTAQESRRNSTVRDMALLGDIVDSVFLLAELMGWSRDFEEIIKKGPIPI